MSSKDLSEYEVPEGYVLVKKEPSQGLLISMAVRYDHGLAVPGYYDMISDGVLTHDQRMKHTIDTMRKLHEEVVGAGFYHEEREEMYTKMQQNNS